MLKRRTTSILGTSLDMGMVRHAKAIRVGGLVRGWVGGLEAAAFQVEGRHNVQLNLRERVCGRCEGHPLGNKLDRYAFVHQFPPSQDGWLVVRMSNTIR